MEGTGDGEGGRKLEDRQRLQIDVEGGQGVGFAGGKGGEGLLGYG